MQAQLINTFRAHPDSINAIVALSEKRLIATGGADNHINIWSLDSDEMRFSLKGHDAPIRNLVNFPHINFLVSGGDDGKVCLWNGASGEPIRELVGHQGAVTALAISSNGKQIISGSEDKTVLIWDSLNGKQLHICDENHAGVYAITISPDGKYFITGEAGLGEHFAVRVWDYETGAYIRDITICSQGIKHLTFSQSGLVLISTLVNGDIILWDWETGQRINTIETQLAVTSIAYTHNRHFAILGIAHPVIPIWSIETGRRIHSLDEPSAAVCSLCTTQYGQIIAGCTDGMLHIYRLQQS